MEAALKWIAAVSFFWISFSGLTFAAGDETAETPAYTPAEIEKILDEKFAKGQYSKDGADTCLKCHDGNSDLSAMGIFANVHGRQDLPNGPFQSLQCEACHGPAGDHTRARIRKGKLREPMISFGVDSPLPANKQDSVCLSCHEDRHRSDWDGSAHQVAEVPCAGCHNVHQAHDPAANKLTQTEKCGSCHVEQLASINQRSQHPLKWGEMACSDCHNPHSSQHQSSLNHETLNQQCFECHAEKRGPFLWEHAPVAEDCSLCHTPHGSINTALLKARTPQLCQTCHAAAGHPSVAYTGTGVEVDAPSTFVLGQSCLNCHSQVHGSNHPSGNLLQR
jgi:DmsE family decaheme c-type cytochrome